MDDTPQGSYEAAVERSRQIEADLVTNPQNYRVLTGDRPTGRLHIGHLFGSLQNRVRLQNLGVATYVVIADYQVLTDRETFDAISENTLQLAIDYLAVGLDPVGRNTTIFPHSQIPELNQLLLPFLTLVTMAELDRNPTVKEEIQAAGLKRVNAGMYTYPVHQAADILFCKANLVPVGQDQLPHVELTRLIARRFNERYGTVFGEPAALLSKAPLLLGTDGGKMSKSRGNAIAIGATADETRRLIRGAKTDSVRGISYDPATRPEVSSLVLLAALCLDRDPVTVAEQIGAGGAAKLKDTVTEAANERFAAIRARRAELATDPGYLRQVLRDGCQRAGEIGEATLDEVRAAMGMRY